MSGAFESTLLSPPRSTNKLFMETGFGVNAGFERYRNSEYAVSDGATSNRAAGIYGPFDAVNNPREWIVGAAVYTVAGIVTIPSTTPSAYIGILNVQATTTANVDNRGMRVYLGNINELVVDAQGAAFAADRRSFTNATFRTTYSGQTIFLKVTLTQGTATNPIVEVNGVNISASFTLATTGTPPAWLDAAMVPTYRLVGYNWPAGPAPIVTPILGATSAADDAFYMATGKWPAWVVSGGSALQLMPNSGFTADPTISANGGWSLDTGNITWDSVNNEIDISTAGGAFLRGQISGTNKWSFAAYQTPTAFLLTFTIKNYVSGTIRIGDSSGTALKKTDGTSVSDITANGTYSYQVIGYSVQARLMIGTFGAANYSIDDVTLTPIGALSIPAMQPINVLDDVSGIGTNCGLILGAATTATSNKKVWRIADLTKTSGNEQLLGGAVFVGTSQDYIKSWTIVNAGGTTTVSLGNVSGGAQYLSGLSVPTGTTVVTLLTNTPLTTNLWCNASTTASLTHVIEGYRTV